MEERPRETPLGLDRGVTDPKPARRLRDAEPLEMAKSHDLRQPRPQLRQATERELDVEREILISAPACMLIAQRLAAERSATPRSPLAAPEVDDGVADAPGGQREELPATSPGRAARAQEGDEGVVDEHRRLPAITERAVPHRSEREATEGATPRSEYVANRRLVAHSRRIEEPRRIRRQLRRENSFGVHAAMIVPRRKIALREAPGMPP